MSHADAAVVVRVNSRSDTALRWLPLDVHIPEIFPVGVGRTGLQICTVVRTVYGEGVEEDAEIVLVHPPSRHGHRGFAHIVHGNSLLLVRELTREEQDLLKQRISEVRFVDWDATDVEFWTLAEPDEQWMGFIQLSAIPVERAEDGIGYVVREDQETSVLRGRLVEQVVHHAGVERDETAVVDYIQELFVLRDSVIAGTEWRGKATPDSEEDGEWDVFQRQVLRMALRKRAESKD